MSSGNRLSGAGKSDIEKKLRTILNQYARYINPPPAVLSDGERWYRWAVTEEELAAMDVLRESQWQRSYRPIVSSGSFVTVNLDSLESMRDFIPGRPEMTIRLPEGWPYPGATMTDEDIACPETRKAVLQWAVKYFHDRHCLGHGPKYASAILEGRYTGIGLEDRMKLQTEEAKMDNAFYGVNTPGQLYAIWPGLTLFAYPSYRNRILKMRQKPRPPRDLPLEWIEALHNAEYFKRADDALLSIAALGKEEIENGADHYNYPI